tara:strand:+ start:11146 stop:11928 length:783 start_codon:yes stop_codon:yes gene_type:complete
MSKGLSYPVELINCLEVFWGPGFLSPGGPSEVFEILRGIPIRGRSVLDIGCGIAGPAIVMARDMYAQKVVGVDVEPQVIARGTLNVTNADLRSAIELKLIKPGPLPFSDEKFDVVFSKDSLIHIRDKATFFREILRVLKPNGIFAASDWLTSDNSDKLPEFKKWVEISPHKFAMQTKAQTEKMLYEVGFANVLAEDKNDWYVDLSLAEIERMEGPLRERFLEVCGEDDYQEILKIRRANAEAARCGGLRPTHLRGFKVNK